MKNRAHFLASFIFALPLFFSACADNAAFSTDIHGSSVFEDFPAEKVPEPEETPTVTPTPTATPSPTPPPRDLSVEFPKTRMAPNLATTLTYQVVLRGGTKAENVKLWLDRSTIDTILDGFAMKDQVKISFSETDVNVAIDEVKKVDLKIELLRTDLPAFQTGKLKLKAAVGNKNYEQENEFWIQAIVGLELKDGMYYLNDAPIADLTLRKLYANLTDINAISILVKLPAGFNDSFKIDNVVVRDIFGPFGTLPMYAQFFVRDNSGLGDGFIRLCANPNVLLNVHHIP